MIHYSEPARTDPSTACLRSGFSPGPTGSSALCPQSRSAADRGFATLSGTVFTRPSRRAIPACVPAA
jgi:hypothetical protein